jgi:hypothetical protein
VNETKEIRQVKVSCVYNVTGDYESAKIAIRGYFNDLEPSSNCIIASGRYQVCPVSRYVIEDVEVIGG